MKKSQAKKNFPPIKNERTKTANLISETLREIKEEVTHNIPQEISRQLTGFHELKPGQEVSPRPQPQENQESKEKLSFYRSYRQQIEEERQVLNQEKEEISHHVLALRKEIEHIAKESRVLAEKSKKTISENPPQPGQYHLNFLEKLLSHLKRIRRSIEEANLWLTAFQQRSKKRRHFWKRFQKSGTKFLFAPDRTPATQTE